MHDVADIRSWWSDVQCLALTRRERAGGYTWCCSQGLQLAHAQGEPGAEAEAGAGVLCSSLQAGCSPHCCSSAHLPPTIPVTHKKQHKMLSWLTPAKLSSPGAGVWCWGVEEVIV
eukprot:1547533-Rhodomonas_salina.2